jgi:hypothetical protein
MITIAVNAAIFKLERSRIDRRNWRIVCDRPR